MNTILKTTKLSKNMMGKDIVSDVDMNIKEGEIYGFLGPNGAGKTTIMKMLTNLIIFSIVVNFAEAFPNYKEIFTLSSTFVSVTFIIFASILLSKFIIEEFRNKSITVLFMYPFPRKKLIGAKMLIVFTFTFFFIVLSNVLIIAGFYLFNQYSQLVQDELTSTMLINKLIQILINALTASSISLIPLYFGMRKYPVPTTIISSILVATLLYSGNGSEFSLSTIPFIPILIAIIAAWIDYSVIRKIEERDVI